MVAVELALAMVGAGAGAVLRYLIGGWVSHRMGPGFPWGTLVVNASGCFGLGFLEGAGAHSELLLWGVGSGILAGFTTFSTLMLETLNLALSKEYDRALWNVLGSLTLGFAALLVGLYFGAGV